MMQERSETSRSFGRRSFFGKAGTVAALSIMSFGFPKRALAEMDVTPRSNCQCPDQCPCGCNCDCTYCGCGCECGSENCGCPCNCSCSGVPTAHAKTSMSSDEFDGVRDGSQVGLAGSGHCNYDAGASDYAFSSGHSDGKTAGTTGLHDAESDWWMYY